MLHWTVLFAVSFVLSALLVRFGAKFNARHGIVGTDINKRDKALIPESVGIFLLPGLFAVSILFLAQPLGGNIWAWLMTTAAFSIIGFSDDFSQRVLKKDIPWRVRAAAIALVSLAFAFFYSQDFAPWPLWMALFSLYLAGMASFQNTFAGLNGWEVGSGFIVSVFVALLLSPTRLFWPAVALSGAILGLLFFNRFPARVFPGDSGTLLIGSALASLLLMSQDLRIIAGGFLFFLPHAIDFYVIKLGTNISDATQKKSKPYAVGFDGKLSVPGSGKSGLDFAKVIIRAFGPLAEWKIVAVIWFVVAANCAFWFYFFSGLV